MKSLVCVKDFEAEAFDVLNKNARNYFKSGADDELTVRKNGEAFSRLLIRPRMLRDVSTRKLKKNILGKSIQFPVGVAPTAFQSLVHPTAEIESAKAAASTGTIFVLSTFSNWSIEDVGNAAPGGRKWFQLFPNTEKKITLDLITRAENAGFEAIVITLDAQNFGKKRDIMREPFKLPENLKMANFEKYQTSDKSAEDIGEFVHSTLAQDMTWDTISWIRSNTNLPVILKGILNPQDAALAVQHNVAGVWVSNHGGRQIDTAIPSIDALPDVVQAVGGKCEVYVDSGIRRGSDVFKALALGADMVFVGRPTIWGIAVCGENGAKRVLEILREELDLTMALSGVADVHDITLDHVQRKKSNAMSKL
ncbi:hydroxyacid oxidase 2-like [Folsomia candida]|uniref:hydroxyacid oxidase 2-like n=1 Tax=Folsomia candida TaxID=158441 RepID=UPI000B9012EF|nr:hydroxyacid oxidase 2-like [Folsomia candida]